MRKDHTPEIKDLLDRVREWSAHPHEWVACRPWALRDLLAYIDGLEDAYISALCGVPVVISDEMVERIGEGGET